MAGQGYSNPLQFGGSTVLPSPTNFTAYSILAGQTVVLAWPVDNFPANANVCTNLMLITALGAGAQLQMPPAENTSLGEKTLIYNQGTVAFTVVDNTGNTIITIIPGAAFYLALIDNRTQAGIWFTFQFGTGTSGASAAALAGAGLAPNGPVLQQVMAVNTLNTNYTSAVSDRDILFNWTGGSGTFTLPLANTVGNNWYIQLRNSGTGTLNVVTQGSDLINAGSTQGFNVSDSAFIVCDGVSWWTIGLGSINTNIFNFQQVSLAGQSGTISLGTVAGSTTKVAYRFIGALAGNTNISVPGTIQQYWVDNETTGGFTLGFGTASQIGGSTQFILGSAARFILYCDGVNVLNAATAGIGLPVAISQGGTGAITASGALTNLGGTSLGVALFTIGSVSAAQTALQTLSASDAVAYAILM